MFHGACCEELHIRWHKKRRLSHDNQSFVNLKSNTMKNTMQRYGFFRDLQ